MQGSNNAIGCDTSSVVLPVQDGHVAILLSQMIGLVNVLKLRGRD